MQASIIRFIRKHHVLVLATAHNNAPHCADVFYAFLEQERQFAFLSEQQTEHIRHIAGNAAAAGSIFLETRRAGKIQGLQLNGRVFPPEGKLKAEARRAYLLRFPYAVLSAAPLWIFEPQRAKFTDNTLGFGSKLIWERPADAAEQSHAAPTLETFTL